MIVKRKVKNHRVANHAKRFFFENIVLMLSSGVDVVTALESLKSESRDKRLNALIDDMLSEMYGGTPFWSVLEKYRILSGNMSKVVKVGEESGNLNNNMRIVLEQMRKDAEINSKLKSASLYPMIVFAVLIVVGLGVAIFILPKLTEVYSSLKIELPDITKRVMELGTFLGGDGKYYVLGGFAGLLVLAYFVFKFSKTKWIGQNLLFSLGPIKKLLTELEFARLGFLVNGLLSSGFSVVESFRILANTTNLHFYSKLYNRIADSVEKGTTFSDLFNNDKQSRKLLPVYIRQAISAAEKSGNLQTTFKQISSTFEMEHQTTVNNLSTAFEPILLFVVWIFVALLAIAVIMPIYSLVGSFTDVQSSNSTPSNVVTVDQPAKSNTVVITNVIVNADVPEAKVYYNIGGQFVFTAKALEQYKVVSADQGWYQIEYAPSTYGWISGKEVTEVK